jgi:hypothetical protein
VSKNTNITQISALKPLNIAISPKNNSETIVASPPVIIEQTENDKQSLKHWSDIAISVVPFVLGVALIGVGFLMIKKRK